MLHRYFVDWSAPNYRDSSSMNVLAGTQQGAITRAKERLGSKVKKLHLNRFTARRFYPHIKGKGRSNWPGGKRWQGA